MEATAAGLYIKELAAFLMLGVLELVCPAQCPGCGIRLYPSSLSERPTLCARCEAKLNRIESPFCPLCGRAHQPRPGFARQPSTTLPCKRCLARRDRPSYDRAFVVLEYSGLARELIHRYKFKGEWWLVSALLPPMLSYISRYVSLDSYDLLCSVPLYHVRERERGFNQARLLLEEMVAASGCEPGKHTEPLQRVHPTLPQSSLPEEKRKSNVRDAFKLARGADVAGASVLLLDDVMGSGSTANECARVLKRAGAQRVDVLVLARSPDTQ